MGMDALNNAQFQQPKQVSSEGLTSAVMAAEGIAPVERVGNVVPKVTEVGNKNGQAKQPTDEQIKSAISRANKKAHFGHTNAEFSYHEPTKRISVKIIDNETNEVIREIPPEETLEMISKMWELAGLMVDEKR